MCLIPLLRHQSRPRNPLPRSFGTLYHHLFPNLFCHYLLQRVTPFHLPNLNHLFYQCLKNLNLHLSDLLPLLPLFGLLFQSQDLHLVSRSWRPTKLSWYDSFPIYRVHSSGYIQ